MPCPSHMVHYTCGHFTVNTSSQPSSCDLENCGDHSWPTSSYLPESCPECSTKSDSVVSSIPDFAWGAEEIGQMEIDIPKRMPERLDPTQNFDDNPKSTSKTPSESETGSSFPDNCECSSATLQYEGCNHTLQTIHRTKGCANECAYSHGSEHSVPGACSDCSARSRLKGDDKEDLRGLRDPRMKPDRLMRLAIEKVEKKFLDQPLETSSIHDGNTKKVEVANEDLKEKFIAALTMTGPIKAIFAEAEQGTELAHEVSWELEANQLFLRLEIAARAGMDSVVDTLKQSFLNEGENFKKAIKSQLEMAKGGVLKQCEAGVKQILEAFEGSGLEDHFPSSTVL